MIVKDGWITTNIRDRLAKPTADFQVTIVSGRAREASFRAATEAAAVELGCNHGDIYLALSGGVDSLYVLDCFMRAHVTIKPVIVSVLDNPLNAHETSYAHRACYTFGIEPIELKLTEAAHVRRFYSDIFKPIRGTGSFGLPSVMTAKLAKERGGIVVSGDGILLANERRCVKLGMNEWDVYSEALVEENLLCPFFVYSPEIVRATLAALPDDYAQTPVCLAKSLIYGHRYRPKVPGAYWSQAARDAARQISLSRPPANPYGSLETRSSLLAAVSADPTASQSKPKSPSGAP